MAFPANATKVHLDAGTDDPAQARVELADLIDKFNSLLGHFPSFAQTLTGRATAPLMRTDLAVLGSQIIRKTVDETVNNSTTLQNDNHLLAALAANETAHFMFYILHIGNGTADFKYAITVPSGATLVHAMPNARVTATGALGGASATTSSASVSAQGTSNKIVQGVWGIVRNSSTPGNLQLQWAQDTATVVDTKVLLDSFLMVWRP